MTVARRLGSGGGSSTRALYAGGSTPSNNDTIDYVTIASTGNATDFGNLASNVFKLGGVSNATRMVMAGGEGPSADINTIQYVTISSTSNTSDFGDLSANSKFVDGASSNHGGLQ